MSQEVSVKELLEAGAHFGHQVSRWNPKMRPYIFTTKGGIHILDLEQTVVALKKAVKFVTDTVALGNHVLFVGTKNQAKPIIEEAAKRCRQFHVNNRWLGGFLTNYKTIKASIERLGHLEKLVQSPDFEKYVKKERVMTEKEIRKLNSIFSGIKTMPGLPGCVFIIDPKTEETAKREANRLKIPVVAIVDTNSSPEGIDYIIPANDDAIRSLQIITGAVADACEEGWRRRQAALVKEGKEDEEKKPSAFAQEKEVKGKGRAYIGGRKKKGEEEEKPEETEPEKFASAKAGEGSL